MKFLQQRCSSASSPGGCRAALRASSNPSDRSLWPTLPGSSSALTAQAITTSPGEYRQEGEEDVGIKQRLRSARELEGMKKENSQEIYSSSRRSGKVYLGPSGKPHLPQGQDSPSAGHSRGPRPRYSQTSVPSAEVLATGRMNALRQGRKRKLPQLWGLLTWKLTRAVRAQRYQVPESPR